MFVVNLLFLLTITSASVSTTQLRTAYFKAAEDASAVNDLQTKVEQFTPKNEIYFAYRGAYYSLLSKNADGLSKKMNLFQKAKADIEKSISMKDNVDGRFIRFCVQNNTPSILKYKDRIEEDKKYLIQELKTMKASAFKEKIKAFLEQSSYLSKTEKEQVKTL